MCPTSLGTRLPRCGNVYAYCLTYLRRAFSVSLFGCDGEEKRRSESSLLAPRAQLRAACHVASTLSKRRTGHAWHDRLPRLLDLENAVGDPD